MIYESIDITEFLRKKYGSYVCDDITSVAMFKENRDYGCLVSREKQTEYGTKNIVEKEYLTGESSYMDDFPECHSLEEAIREMLDDAVTLHVFLGVLNDNYKDLTFSK